MADTPDPLVRNALVRETSESDESIKVFGELDMANAQQFGDEIRRALASGKPVVVDLTRCTYLDSSGVHAMVDIARADSGALRAIVPHDGVISRVFAILGVRHYMEVEYSAPPPVVED